MNRKRTYFALGAVGGLILLFVFLTGGDSDAKDEIVVDVQSGLFRVEVNTTGELEARNSTQILGPSGLRRYRVYQVNIQKIIPEGTYVKKGDFVASLDPSELNTRIKDSEIDLDERNARYVETRLDTALVMREARDKLVNLAYAVEEQQLVLDQSQFEPPATIKKAEIALDKAKRQLEQEKENYKIKKQQNIAKMKIAYSNLREEQLEYDGMKEMLEQFVIQAPEDGMLIYRKGRDGRPMKEGSQISAWDPVVATLPDLSSMNSITYVNEVDIRRVQKGQFVEVGLDAFPDKKLTGRVTQVANVGEQRPNSDSKVFMVTVEIDRIDGSLRPGMTTSNIIVTKEIPETVFVPLESLHTHNDTITFVFKANGIGLDRQEVSVGETNANFAEILLGLSASERVYLSTPGATDSDDINLIPEMNGKRNKKQAQEEQQQPQPSKRERKKERSDQPNS